MVYGLRRQPFRLGAGRADTQQRHKGRFGVRRVLSGRLAELIGGSRGVEHIVGDLKSESDGVAVGPKPFDVIATDVVARGQTTDYARSRDQRAGLAAMHLLQRL